MPIPVRPWRCRVPPGALLSIALAAGCAGGGAGPSNDADPDPAFETAPKPRIDVAVNDPAARAPFDATPSPDARQVYFTAVAGERDGDGLPGVFVVAAEGGEIRTLARGEPLAAPVNISISLNGEQLFVADPASDVIFTLPTAGGEPVALEGTEGFTPRGLTIAAGADGREYLYFTGREPASERTGLFRVDVGGGAVETVGIGDPFTDPAGVAVAARGTAYVVDTGIGATSARVIQVERGELSLVAAGIGVGFPAGITLTRDDSTLLVSGLDPESRRDVVYYVDTESRRISRLTDTVGRFREPAGLHRAHDVDVFAWADSEANDTGTVYLLTLKGK